MKTIPGRSVCQNLTDIAGNHYGVNVEASERNGWGQWHRADEKGVGMDRTTATGTGYIGQYRPPRRERLRILYRLPRRSAAVFHHVPYTHKLHSGQNGDTVHLRLPLRRRRRCGKVRPGLEIPEAAHR